MSPDPTSKQSTSTTTRSAAEKFRQGVIALLAEFEQARQEAGDERGTNPFDEVEAIAAGFEQSEDDEQARQAFLTALAQRLTLDNVRTLRLAGEAAVAATPQVIKAEAGHKKPKRIADEVGLSLSRIYQILRSE
ncbi:hypothetical protein AB0A60_32390 [Streptomyces sp. NPDC046275]|uniref:hypothetical protein n=1 Tax=Streptomyces sp. NPDC046275 TaxID=3157201 RepID=UPI0034105CFB